MKAIAREGAPACVHCHEQMQPGETIVGFHDDQELYVRVDPWLPTPVVWAHEGCPKFRDVVSGS